ncbi:MAG: hypothetical protein ACOCUL_05105 [Bacteroidota bacterium]
MDITFELASTEEMHLYWYLKEIQEAGFIHHLKYQPKPFFIHDAYSIEWKDFTPAKTKKKTYRKNLLLKEQYTADFYFRWDPKIFGILFMSWNKPDILDNRFKTIPFISNYNTERDYHFSIIDVKGSYNQNDAYRRFSKDQKNVFYRYNIYVQKIIPKDLFKQTFIPSRYLFCDKETKRTRKINFEIMLMKQYLKKHNYEII